LLDISLLLTLTDLAADARGGTSVPFPSPHLPSSSPDPLPFSHSPPLPLPYLFPTPPAPCRIRGCKNRPAQFYSVYEMTYNVLMGTLNPNHSLTHSHPSSPFPCTLFPRPLFSFSFSFPLLSLPSP